MSALRSVLGTDADQHAQARGRAREDPPGGTVLVPHRSALVVARER